jgi:hypothetical protein
MNDVQIGITYEGITNDIQVGEAEANVEEGREDNENEWTNGHFYGNIDMCLVHHWPQQRGRRQVQMQQRGRRE